MYMYISEGERWDKGGYDFNIEEKWIILNEKIENLILELTAQLLTSLCDDEHSEKLK